MTYFLSKADAIRSLFAASRIVDALWITYLVYCAYAKHGSADRNFWAEPLLAPLLTASIALHLTRWRLIAKEGFGGQVTSAVALTASLRSIADQTLGSAPYLPKFAPMDQMLSERAQQLISEGSVDLPTKSEAMKLLFCTPRLQPVHVMCVVACGMFLWHGDFPSFAALMSPFWPALAVLLVLTAGIFVQSTVFLLYTFLFI